MKIIETIDGVTFWVKIEIGEKVYRNFEVGGYSITIEYNGGRIVREDTYGFLGWVKKNKGRLIKLGIGKFEGVWWGNGIGRGYGIEDRRFSLVRDDWKVDVDIDHCPILYEKVEDEEKLVNDGIMIRCRKKADITLAYTVMEELVKEGSRVVKGFMKPYGIGVYYPWTSYVQKIKIGYCNLPKRK